MENLLARCSDVIENETRVVSRQLDRNRVELIEGEASFTDAHTLKVSDSGQSITADFMVIATGTVASRPASIPFEEGLIFDADTFRDLTYLPRSLVVVGAGVVGTEYASILALLDIEVILVDQRSRLLDFVDAEIAQALAYHMRDVGVTLYFSEEVVSIEKMKGKKVRTTLKSGKRLVSDALLYAVGRMGATDSLNLEQIGIQVNARRRIRVNDQFQTSVPHVFAVGDVIGFPSLASTSMEQGRLAACHAFGAPTYNRPELIPYGIYSVPEISMVGKNEQQLRESKVPYEIGVARYREIARGQILGDRVGMLKLILHQKTRKLLGVHAIGQGATELIHIGQAVLAFEGEIDFFIENTFNYPTLAECYRVAALDGHNKLAELE